MICTIYHPDFKFKECQCSCRTDRFRQVDGVACRHVVGYSGSHSAVVDGEIGPRRFVRLLHPELQVGEPAVSIV